RALAKNQAARWATCAELVEELEEALGMVHAAQVAEPRAAGLRRWWYLAAAAAAFAALAVAAAIVAGTGRRISRGRLAARGRHGWLRGAGPGGRPAARGARRRPGGGGGRAPPAASPPAATRPPTSSSCGRPGPRGRRTPPGPRPSPRRRRRTRRGAPP